MQKKLKREKIILEIITKSNQIGISDILVRLEKEGLELNKRTLLRDLKSLMCKGLIFQNIKGKNTIYYITDGNKILQNINIEKYFIVPYLERAVKESFNFDVFKTLENDVFTIDENKKLEDYHRKFIENFSRYDSQTLINKEFERIMIEFSWKSSAIEGNTYSFLNTEALIKENVRDQEKTEAETQMILNHKDAFNESIQNKNRFLNIHYSDIEYLHKVLTKKLNITTNIRNAAVGVSGTKYKPLDNSFQIKEVLQEMVELINNKKSFFEKSFLSLILLSYIQAFEDGNKRTARMVSNAILLAHNSIPLSYRVVDIVEYKKASILFYEMNNISYFKKIFIEQVEDSVNNYFR